MASAAVKARKAPWAPRAFTALNREAKVWQALSREGDRALAFTNFSSNGDQKEMFWRGHQNQHPRLLPAPAIKEARCAARLPRLGGHACHYKRTARTYFAASRKTTTSRTKSRRRDSASAEENDSLLTNIAPMTCCPRWRRPSKTSRRRSARVHSEGLPVMPGRLVGAGTEPSAARSSDKQ